MTETEDKKTKTSKLVIASLILATPVIVMAVVTLFIHSLVIDMPGFVGILLLMLTLASIVLTFLSLHLINKCKGKTKGKNLALVVLIIVYSSFAFMFCHLSGIRYHPPWTWCQGNLRQLKVAIDIYSYENDGKYPTADKWCDLIKDDFVKDALVCTAKSRKVERCSYAVNPNCEPNSPADVVLLFETQGGWNQHGGPELLNAQNHPDHKNDFWGYKIPGCNVMFNDGHAEFVPKKRFAELKWKAE
jgi:hypothetical protein